MNLFPPQQTLCIAYFGPDHSDGRDRAVGTSQTFFHVLPNTIQKWEYSGAHIVLLSYWLVYCILYAEKVFQDFAAWVTSMGAG